MPAPCKVLLAMSGGVDSSVAAALLLREGHDVVGCFMRLGSPGETFDELVCAVPQTPAAGLATEGSRTPLRIHHQGCCSINDAADARLVAAKLGIPLYIANFKKDFGRIVDYFVGEYDAGRTPNPCVRCNDWLKFGKLFDYATQIDAEFIATGHYAQVRRGPDGARLLRGADRAKDQSYVLFGMTRDRLERVLLPVGGHEKGEIRAIARELDLPVFDKPDSQEICFVPDNDYAGLVARRSGVGVTPGAIVDERGEVLGEHPGHQHFTIGQRRGIGIAASRPLYVLDKVASTNTVVVGDREALLAIACTAREVNWLAAPAAPREWFRCHAQVRAHGEAIPATAVALRGSDGRDELLEIRFDVPTMAVAPGQAVVLYDGDTLLGGGWIAAVDRAR
jgi:tRNA-specific 2-thiouridylase